MSDASIAILVLAGGRASRFPGKLEALVDGEPLVLRAFRTARATGWPVYVSAQGPFPAQIDGRLDCPVLIDRQPLGGPLRALHSACETIAQERIFVLAADLPRVDTPLLERVAAAWLPGDDAVVPRHEGRLEPLVALYARAAILQESFTLFGEPRSSMHDLIERIGARFLDVEAEHFANVNTPADLAALSRPR
ncbi:MAG TPA: molybdenum cofactor guanylyltransferase [Candidatus Baltobacteraceae bacterium]|nr:molybdenum cofactor guanylyltransferase [Candidatus Baltobacteraceae bacterium]